VHENVDTTAEAVVHTKTGQDNSLLLLNFTGVSQPPMPFTFSSRLTTVHLPKSIFDQTRYCLFSKNLSISRAYYYNMPRRLVNGKIFNFLPPRFFRHFSWPSTAGRGNIPVLRILVNTPFLFFYNIS